MDTHTLEVINLVLNSVLILAVYKGGVVIGDIRARMLNVERHLFNGGKHGVDND